MLFWVVELVFFPPAFVVYRFPFFYLHSPPFYVSDIPPLLTSGCFILKSSRLQAGKARPKKNCIVLFDSSPFYSSWIRVVSTMLGRTGATIPRVRVERVSITKQGKVRYPYLNLHAFPKHQGERKQIPNLSSHHFVQYAKASQKRENGGTRQYDTGPVGYIPHD